MRRSCAFAPVILPLLVGCASTPGARPNDMSAAQHEAAAAVAERQAEEHEAQYNPQAQPEGGCSVLGPGSHVTGSCWTDLSNPTREHLEVAEQLRRAAADHRAASAALRDAEGRACGGLSPDDRDVSPFAHRQDIVSVVPLNEDVNTGWEPATRMAGAVVTFRAVPGMSAQWLQHVIDCHLARIAVIGHDAPEMSFCPLQPKVVTAKVSQTPGGFSVSISASDPTAAREVLRRAQALVERE